MTKPGEKRTPNTKAGDRNLKRKKKIVKTQTSEKNKNKNKNK